MTFQEYKEFILSDLYRIEGKKTILNFIKLTFFTTPTLYKYNFWLRTCRYIKEHRYLKYIFLPFCHLIYKHYCYKYGIDIPYMTDIGKGFYIGHFGSIVINEEAKIGKNCNISNGVTIGQTNRGKKKGTPVIKDNVYIASGAKIIGAVTIGDNAAIGANAVVTKDIPSFGVAAGVPAKVISKEGSNEYINKVDYE